MEVALNHDTRRNKDDTSSESEVDSDVEKAGLKARKPRQQQFSGGIAPGPTKPDNNDGEPSENSAYLNKYGGAIEDLNIEKIRNAVQHDAKTETETEKVVKTGREVPKAKSEQIEEMMEEEVVELEFERAISKLHTHTMHCPNCDNHITKVILRRKIIRTQPPVVEQQPEEPKELLGCFSCFSLFKPTDNGGYNPFPIWNNKTSSAAPGANVNGVVSEDGNCFSIFQIWRKEKDSKKPKPQKIDQDSQQTKPDHLDQQSPNQRGDHDSQTDGKQGQIEREYKPPVSSVVTPSHYNDQVKPHEQPETRVDIPPVVSSLTENHQPQRLARQDSTSFEILKSIVYGGLMELIASLSIVASAAAGGASTLNIVALALANLIGGVIVIGHNLWDLKDDCYKFSTQQTTNNQEARNKYKELLGSVEHFPLHAFFAILSFLVFGVIPPMVYGYAFHETNDRDYTMVIVAVASFVCVGLLAIFKAYIDRCTKFAGYVKTITYYLTTAVAASGVSYAVGNLVERLIVELGLFEMSSNVAMTVVPEVVSMNPSLAYY